MTQGIQLTVTGSELTKMCEAQAAIQQKNAVDEKESKAKYLNSLSPKDHAAYSSGYRDPGYEKAAECWRFLATHFVPMDNYFAGVSLPTTAGQAGSKGHGERVSRVKASAPARNAHRSVNQPSSANV